MVDIRAGPECMLGGRSIRVLHAQHLLSIAARSVVLIDLFDNLSHPVDVLGSLMLFSYVVV